MDAIGNQDHDNMRNKDGMSRRIFSIRSRYVFCLFTLCCCSFIWSNVTRNDASSKNFLDHLGYLDYNFLDSPDFKQRFTIQTDGCEIPAMAPLDPSIREFVASPNPAKCDDASTNLLQHNNTHIWTKEERAKQFSATLSCCYRAFSRTQTAWIGSPSVDERVQYNVCTNFTKHIVVFKDEFVRVTCYNASTEIHDQFFLFAPRKDFLVHNDVKELKNDNSSYNVLVLGIDSVSRLNLYRTMPKTVKFLKNKGAIELLGYNKVADNTFPNLVPMLLGMSSDEFSRTCVPHKGSTFDNCPFVWEWFKQAGYYTAFAEDSSWLGTFNYLRGEFVGTPTDYYPHTFISEAENLIRKRNIYCLGDKYLYQMLLDYTEDLMMTLKSSRLFGFIWETVLTHDYLNYPAIMDDSYAKFLKRLEHEKYLEETILFLVSDHGMRYGGITSTKQGRLEARLPFVFVLGPPSFITKYSEAYNNLKMNSKRLTSPYNLHAMLNDLANLNNIENENIILRSKKEYWNHRNISLFLPIPGNRTCQLAGISDHWCACHKDIPISKESALVKEASEYLIMSMNQMLRNHEHCAKLGIEKLIEAREMIVEKVEQNEVGWREVIVVVRTRPGQGEFEATLRHQDGGQWALAGQVGRLNLYGNQSHCIDDNLLKLYCYCIT